MTSPRYDLVPSETYADLLAEVEDLRQRNARLEDNLDKAVRLVDEIDKLSALFWAA